ncbi:MAG: FTR1 family protein [Lachnospiraceae bacterium]|nr:FTR1 family protein [Lachnospiraceae bacterium]
MKQRRGIPAGFRSLMILLLAVTLVMAPVSSVLAAAEDASAGNRWGAAADEIDKYLDAAFEAYLAGDAKAAYSNVNDAYFKVYEVTGFERQTMSYVSGPRKNAVELQYSTCKAAVKKDNTDPEVQKEVRTELNKLKSMIREDGNKLAQKDGEEQTVTKYYLNGELTATDPYADYAGDPNAAVTYASWAAAAEALNELLDTAFTAYKGKDFEAAKDNTQTAFYMVYEESGLDHALYKELSVEDRLEVDQRFADLQGLIEGEKFQRNAVQRAIRQLKNVITAKAASLDEAAAAKAAEEAAKAAEEAAAEETTTEDQSWLTFLAAFGIIVREGLEAILVIAAIIAYLAKSGNKKSLKNVYVGGVLGIAASFVAAAILYYVKQAWTGAGQSQEFIEGITALIAVCVLFYVSNWMISKSEAAAWSNYIDGKVQSSVERGSAMALAFTAFLSVFREGAEVVLFYQPMLGEGHANMVWAGFAAGCVLLVFVYLAITKLSIKLPIKIFFTATSILMAVMCVSFLGAGIKELAEGGLFDVVLRVTGIPENDVIQIFGIYPYLETLVPQLILAVILLVTFMMAHYRNKLALKDAEIRKLQGSGN